MKSVGKIVTCSVLFIVVANISAISVAASATTIATTTTSLSGRNNVIYKSGTVLNMRGGGSSSSSSSSGINHNNNVLYKMTRDDKSALSLPSRKRQQQQPQQQASPSSAACDVRGGTTTTSTTTTTRRRRRGWPVAYAELPRFASLSAMMFLFIYVFTTVRDTKDTLVVSHCGAESIPFLKLYAVMPSAALFIVAYSNLSNTVGRHALFFLTLLPFFAFYTVFAFVLYPLRDTLHGGGGRVVVGNSGGTGPVASLVRHWSFSLYFIVSELWASAGVPLLFWSCANDVTHMAQAKRFYPLFAVFGNLAPILSGAVMSTIVSRQTSNDDAAFGKTLKMLAVVKLVALAGICLLYRAVYVIVAGTASDTTTSPSAPPPKKKNVSLGESVRELSRSTELRSIATMVLCYNVCVELTEVVWKGLLRRVHPNKSDYMSYMAGFSQQVGVVALCLQLCASYVIDGLGWRRAALVTPVAMCVLAVPFFASVAWGEQYGISLHTALLIGTVQNLVSKVTKYTLFDPCKEMAYIPLGPEAKVKGKAGVDVLGSRLGRSLGSAGQQLLVVGSSTGNILACAPSLGVLYVVTVGCWSRAVNVLGELNNSDDDDRDDDTPP